jgi:hypothetical protein
VPPRSGAAMHAPAAAPQQPHWCPLQLREHAERGPGLAMALVERPGELVDQPQARPARPASGAQRA